MGAVSAVLSIVLIDLVLSGDNAVVIGMAAAPLPRRQRRAAIVVGAGVAVALRVTLTTLAAALLQVPALSAIGGLLLLWIAFKLLKQEEESAAGVKGVATFRGAVVTIVLADFVMSLDNVLGVAAASHGVLPLIVFGLALSMAIVMVGGGVIAELIGRARWLAYLGAAVIAWTGAEMFQSDKLVLGGIGGLMPLHPLISGILTVGTISLAHWLHRMPHPARRPRATDEPGSAPG
jgi:YjbE family integral membrane protein